jgi:hypothetical protein
MATEKQCKGCSRPLQHGETNLCPACKAQKSRKLKMALEVGGTVLLSAAVIALKIFTRGKGGGTKA